MVPNIRFLLGMSALWGLVVSMPAQAYKLSAVTVLGDPIAPPLVGKQGDGFCVKARQARTGTFRVGTTGNYLLFDASNLFGTEQFMTPDPNYNPTDAFLYRIYDTNSVTAGQAFPTLIDKFLDAIVDPNQSTSNTLSATTIPNQSLGPIYIEKFKKFFDLSSGALAVDPNGDYTNGNPGDADCPDPKGCPFTFGSLSTLNSNEQRYQKPRLLQMFPESNEPEAFRDTAMRFTGLLNVTPDWVNRRILIGMYADDAGSVTISDKDRSYRVISVASNRCEACATVDKNCFSTYASSGGVIKPMVCQNLLGKPWCQPCDPRGTGQRWRVSNEIKFQKPGLYPIQIHYAQFAGAAALEVSVYVVNAVEDPLGDNFRHWYQNWGWNQTTPSGTYDPCFEGGNCPKPISNYLFNLLDPKRVFQSVTGEPLSCAYQCDPKSPNSKDCVEGSFCNPAGICEPCDASTHCGPSCKQCGADKPVCSKVNNEYKCVECNADSDCSGSQTCTTAKACSCQNDNQCPRGQICTNNRCSVCTSDVSCQGNSCSTCPPGTRCLSANTNLGYECVECTPQTGCGDINKICDPNNFRCVDSKSGVSSSSTVDCCGASCSKCPTDRPLCLNGKVCVECKTDLNCDLGYTCVSGSCMPCVNERRCGYDCRACPPNKPFCDESGGPEFAHCVGCTDDGHCGPGGVCNKSTGLCSVTDCTASCGPGTYCRGDKCLQCVSDAGCAPGEYCDAESGTCTGGCADSSDCLGGECCTPGIQQCEPGRCKITDRPQGGALCCDANGCPGTALEEGTTNKRQLAFSFICFATLAGLSLILAWWQRGQKKAST